MDSSLTLGGAKGLDAVNGFHIECVPQVQLSIGEGIWRVPSNQTSVALGAVSMHNIRVLWSACKTYVGQRTLSGRVLVTLIVVLC
jgi:hypothetical protein